MQFQKTKYQGVYYRESETKKYKSKLDRCFYIKYYIGSKQHREKIGWLSEGYSAESALAVRNERLHIRRNHNNHALGKKAMFFSEAAELYFAWAETEKKTWKDDKGRYELHIKKVFGDMRIDTIKPQDVIAFYQKLRVIKNEYDRPFAPQTILHYIKTISQIYNWLSDTERYEGSNPAMRRKIKMAKFDNSRELYLYDDEIVRLMDICENATDIPEDDRILIMFALCSGMRKSEIFNLSRSKINMSTHRYRLVGVKGGKDVTIYLPSIAIDLLRRLPIHEDEDLFFPSHLGGLRQDNRKVWTEVKRRAQIRDEIVFHDLRHTFGVLAARAKVPVEVIQKLMTHKSIKTTMRYVHIVDQSMLEGTAQFSGLVDALSVDSSLLAPS